MIPPKILEGTTEEITLLLKGGTFAGKRLRVIFVRLEKEEVVQWTL